MTQQQLLLFCKEFGKCEREVYESFVFKNIHKIATYALEKLS